MTKVNKEGGEALKTEEAEPNRKRKFQKDA